jgi:polyisoprenoid-binding protein YceI
MKVSSALLLVAFLGAGSLRPAIARAEAEWFAIDPVHTRVLFFVDHARFSRSIGLFRPVEGGLWFDENDWARGHLEICLPLARLDMGDRGWTQALMRPDFFDADRHPDICFKSNRVERIDETHGRLHGELSLRGETRAATFDFTLNDLRRFSLTLKRRLGISARAELSRADFGIDRDKTLIGDKVEVVVELEAQIADPPADAAVGAHQPSDEGTR